MNLREILKSLNNEEKKEIIENIDLCSYANYFTQDNNGHFFSYEIKPKFDEIATWNSGSRSNLIGAFPLTTDHAATILTRKEALELLKEEYTLNNLPEKWFVEYSDEIDLDLLREKLNGEYQGIHNYYGIGKKYRSSRQIEYFDDCINLTHLFKKQDQKMETIEIDGKKYRLVPEQANFKNCDLVMKDGNVYEFIGYYEADVVIKGLISGGLSQYENVGLFKLEEIKTKIWHYAIYRDEDELCHSNFYSHENLLKKDRPDALEYRTFEEQL